MTTQPIPFQASGAPPRPPGPLPIMEELNWLRDAVEMQMRVLKYWADNYNSLLQKVEGEGITLGEPTFGPNVANAVGAILAPGRYLVTSPGSLTVALTAGTFITVSPTTSVATAISTMAVT